MATNLTSEERTITRGESFRDSISTVDSSGRRKWVFAQKPKGRLYNYRTLTSYIFLIIFITLPFIYVNGRPLFLFNVTEAKFILFGKVFWPQDFFIFGLTMVTFIVFIVLFTSAFGRLFCGWVCPQTIFMEMLFRKIEYAIEGSAAKQKMMAKGTRNAKWFTRKLLKHAAFLLLSFIIANLFLSYVIGVKELYKIISEPVTEHIGGFFSILVFSVVFYAVYAYFREQVCTVVCPYGRLQSVLLDKNSMIVAYDYKRGEPRSKFAGKKIARIDTGDCIDCFQCVKVCPTGIDIRNGTQMECVGCTACIDACNIMMANVGKPAGLIRYASENGIQKSEKLAFTFRMKFYLGLLLMLTLLLSFMLYTRKEIDTTIMRTPGLLYQEVGKDSLSNLYNIKVANKTVRMVPLQLKLEGMSGNLRIVGEHPFINVQKEGQGAGSFFVVLPRNLIHQRKVQLSIGLYEGSKRIDVVKTNFLGIVDE